jgi:endonuclease III
VISARQWRILREDYLRPHLHPWQREHRSSDNSSTAWKSFTANLSRHIRQNPYEMILYINCGYPATDASCAKAFEALKRSVGIAVDDILRAPKEEITESLRLGGIFPEVRAARLKKTAALVKQNFAGDLRTVLKKPLPEAKRALKKFPTIGDPSAEKILLFTKTSPIAAIPSNCVHVPLRLGFGEEKKNYAASYRSAQEAIRHQIATRRRFCLV